MFTESVDIDILEILPLSFSQFDITATQIVFSVVTRETCYISSCSSLNMSY